MIEHSYQVQRVSETLKVYTAKSGRLWFTVTNRKVGQTAFTADVPRELVPFVVQMVEQLGLQQTPIVVGRGSAPTRNRQSLGIACRKDEFADAAAVYYSRRIRVADRAGVPFGDSAVYVSAAKAILTHELVHIAYPGKDESWVQDKAYDLVVTNLVQAGDFDTELPSSAILYDFSPSAETWADR
jgi:hypothetical protein